LRHPQSSGEFKSDFVGGGTTVPTRAGSDCAVQAPLTIDKAGGTAMTESLLLASPEINVTLGQTQLCFKEPWKRLAPFSGIKSVLDLKTYGNICFQTALFFAPWNPSANSEFQYSA
jgi:hypothetical protein